MIRLKACAPFHWPLLPCLVLLVAIGGGASYARPAAAARPMKGADYYGFDGRLRDLNFPFPSTSPRQGSFEDVSAELRVSRTRRRFSGRGSGSHVDLTLSCKRDKRGYVDDAIRLASRRVRGPRIRRDGSFGVVKRTGALRYRLRGRFLSPDTVKVRYRVSDTPLRPKNPSNPGRCTSSRRRAVLVKDGQPPFRGCRRQRARTLVRSSTGRIFMQYRLTGQGGFFPYVFGCLFTTNRRFALSQDYDDEAVVQIRLAGTYAAYGQDFCEMGCGFGLQVRDLRNGRKARAPDTPGEVTDLELKDNGSVAWISDRALYDPAFRERTVWADDTAGHRRLDSGKISPRSLALNGSTLTWRKDGLVRSATVY